LARELLRRRNLLLIHILTGRDGLRTVSMLRLSLRILELAAGRNLLVLRLLLLLWLLLASRVLL
jgi:hypothetical protein